MKKTRITEKDIYLYVFNPFLLEPGKSDYIGRGHFSKEIEFYSGLKEFLDDEITDDLRKRISSKISAYKDYRPSSLLPIPEIKKETEITRLAAETPVRIPAVESKTFVSGDKSYLVRLIKSGDISSIYVFSSNSAVLKNFFITLYPERRKIAVESNGSPVILNEKINIDSIDISFS